MRISHSLLFGATAVLYLLVIFFSWPMTWAFKVLPIIVLAYSCLVCASAPLKKGLLLALVFSGIGDLLLAFDLFIYGVGAFLLAQLSYTWLFMRNWQSFATRWPVSIVLLVYVITMALLLAPNLGDLAIPVYGYLVVIASMGLLATQSKLGFYWAVSGALTFIASDSFIAINKFLLPIPGESYWIMLTYYAAQWQLVYGLMHHYNDKAQWASYQYSTTST